MSTGNDSRQERSYSTADSDSDWDDELPALAVSSDVFKLSDRIWMSRFKKSSVLLHFSRQAASTPSWFRVACDI